MDAPNLLVRAGDPAPGTGADVVFGGPAIPLGWPGINAGHAIVFRGYLRGPDVTVQNDSGVWLYDGERRELLVRSGQSASGTEMGAVFDGGENAFSDPVIAREGHVAFLARLRGPSVDSTNAEGIWAGKPGAIRLVLRQGAEVATAPGRYWKVKSLGLPSLNRLGDVAFSAVLFDPEAPQQSVPSLWVWVNGCLAPIVWGGASIDLDLPPVSGIGFVGEGSGSTGGDDGRPKGLNARREVVYIATFEGGSSGAYRSRITVGEAPVSLAAVPTPAGPELRFTVPLGCLYRLESAGDLGAQDGWEPVGETRMGDGGLTTLHPPNGESHRYYRLAFP